MTSFILKHELKYYKYSILQIEYNLNTSGLNVSTRVFLSLLCVTSQAEGFLPIHAPSHDVSPTQTPTNKIN